MSTRLEVDLQRWESGMLSRRELRVRHPGENVDALVSLHSRLVALANHPIPDPSASWSALRDQLPERGPTLGDRVRAAINRLRHPAAVAVAVSVLSGGAAYAAGVEPVRSTVDRVLDSVGSIFSSDDGARPPAQPDRDDETSDERTGDDGRPYTRNEGHYGRNGRSGDPEGTGGSTSAVRGNDDDEVERDDRDNDGEPAEGEPDGDDEGFEPDDDRDDEDEPDDDEGDKGTEVVEYQQEETKDGRDPESDEESEELFE
jgi:hypothetical protein